MKDPNKAKYDAKYAKENYHRIPLEVRKDKYEEIKKAASDNEESINGYIKKAIDDRLNKDKKNKIESDKDNK